MLVPLTIRLVKIPFFRRIYKALLATANSEVQKHLVCVISIFSDKFCYNFIIKSKEFFPIEECQFCKRLFPNTGKGRQSRGTHETAMHWAELQALISSADNEKSGLISNASSSKKMEEIVANPNLQQTNGNQQAVGSVVAKQILLPLHLHPNACTLIFTLNFLSLTQ